MTKTEVEENFEWPLVSTDIERIKLNTKKYADSTIAEAFNDMYGEKYDIDVDKIVNIETPTEPHVGDIITTRIIDINNKDGVIFDTSSFKSPIISKIKLQRFEKFKHIIPRDPIDVQVLEITKRGVVVDVIKPLIDKYVYSILEDRSIQKDMDNPTPTKVKNLQLTRGGFLGDAIIPTVSEFLGEEYTIPAFVPGSMIVLNILPSNMFESYIGQTVDTFLLNYVPKGDKMSLICSAKEYLQYLGDKKLIDIFKAWTESNELWDMIKNNNYEGKVTGVINSKNKCGIFIEIPTLNITGMINISPSKLVNYHPHADIMIRIDSFELSTHYDTATKQLKHNNPYIIRENKLQKCNLRPVFKFAE